MRRSIVSTYAVLLVLFGGTVGAGDFRSGPQKPTMAIKVFNPIHCSGPDAGGKSSLVRQYGNNPVAMIFAREVSDDLGRLVKRIDEATVSNGKSHMGSFVVVCRDDEKTERALRALARKDGLKKTILAMIDKKSGPKGMEIDPKADITVVLYSRRNTKAQFAYAKGEMMSKDIDAILAALPKILPAAK